MKIPKYFYTLVILFGIFMLPKISFASDGQMVHQDSFNQSTDTVQGNGVVGQFLGNGFYGIAKTMSFWSIVVATQTGDHNINYGIYECSDSNCATPIRWQQNLLYDTSGQGIGTAYKNTITLPVAWTLNPNMYYLLVATSNVANHIQFEGTSGDTYAGGICGVFSGGVSYCGSAVDLKFELWGSNVLQLSQVFNIYPTTGSTTPTNLVNWGFSYTDAPSDGITDYQVTFYALGASGKFPVASSTLTITGTPTYGTHDVTGSIYLIAGQQYRMNATLFGSFLGSNNSPLSFPGTATTFWVSTNRAVNPNGGSTGGDVSLIPECDAPASWLDVGTGISWAFCKMFYPSQSVMDQWYDIPNLMQAREPFSFFYDIADSVSSSTATAQDFPNVQFTTATNSVLSNYTVTLFASSTITNVVNAYPTTFALIRLLSNAALWAGFGWVLYSSATKLFDRK